MRAVVTSFFAFIASIGMFGLGYSPQTAAAATLYGCVADDCNVTTYGVVSITKPDLPNFEFTSSTGGLKGTLFVDILVPDNIFDANKQTFSIVDGKTSPTAKLFSAKPWTSGNLGTYLKVSGSPTNPISDYDSQSGRISNGDGYTVTGFDVYQANLGQNTLAALASPKKSPQLDLIGLLPEDSYVVAFLETTATTTTTKKVGKTTVTTTTTTTSYNATANSGAIFEDHATPLPAALPLFASGLGAIGFIGWRRKRRNSSTMAVA
jgi:hypothetical protein